MICQIPLCQYDTGPVRVREGTLRDILRRLGVHVTERSRSGWLQAPCPFAPWTHRSGRDRRPSFGAKIEDAGISSYHCHACGMHGRTSGLVRTLQRYGHDVGPLNDQGYPELAHEADAADLLGISNQPFEVPPEERDPLPVPLNEAAYGGIYPAVEECDEAWTYCQGRGLTLPTARLLGMVWDQDQRRVLFPVKDRGGLLYGWTGRAVDGASEPKVRDYAGLPKRHLVLGEELWRDGLPLMVVEGLFGFAHLIEMGLHNYMNVGALMGHHMTDGKAERIRSLNAPTYLLLDNDPAGDEGLYGTLHRDGTRDFFKGCIGMLFEHVPVKVPAWPEGKDDPDQLTKADVWAIIQDTPLYAQGVVA